MLTGNLSHQIEHHLFPDMPARRYPEIADEVREICEGTAWSTTPAGSRQLGSVWLKIASWPCPTRKKSPGPATLPISPPPPDHECMKDNLSKGEIRKDALQDGVEATATAGAGDDRRDHGRRATSPEPSEVWPPSSSRSGLRPPRRRRHRRLSPQPAVRVQLRHQWHRGRRRSRGPGSAGRGTSRRFGRVDPVRPGPCAGRPRAR